MAQRKGSRGRAVGAVCLDQNVANVNRYGASAEQQAMRNFAVGLSGRHKRNTSSSRTESRAGTVPRHFGVRPDQASTESAPASSSARSATCSSNSRWTVKPCDRVQIHRRPGAPERGGHPGHQPTRQVVFGYIHAHQRTVSMQDFATSDDEPSWCRARPTSSSLRSAACARECSSKMPTSTGRRVVSPMDNHYATARVPSGPTRRSATRAGPIGGSVVFRCTFRSRALAGLERHSFNPTLGTVLHPEDVKARSICLALAATLAAASGPGLAHADLGRVCGGYQPRAHGGAQARGRPPHDSRPAGRRDDHRRGPDDSVTCRDYWGPSLIAGYTSGPIDQYHLVYLLDVDAAPYIGTLLPVPRCDPHIQHTADRRVIFGHVPHGIHTLAVLLTGSNNVSVNPPVAMRETFMVR